MSLSYLKTESSGCNDVAMLLLCVHTCTLHYRTFDEAGINSPQASVKKKDRTFEVVVPLIVLYGHACIS
jgi:hypothetical protein